MDQTIADELDYILRYRVIQTLYQPLIESDTAQVYGYEALTRGPSNSALHAPLPLIQAATQTGRLFELDLVCRELAIRRFQELGLPGRLFLNVNPLSLMEPTFRPGETLRLLSEVKLSPERVVIEITEQQPLDDYDVLKAAVAHYTEAGFEIAIDDLGAGYAGLRLWSELRPSYVKIDHHFIENISTDNVKREFVRSIGGMATRLGCRVVAEGIETVEDYAVVQSLGVRLHQGYHLARPLAEPVRDHAAVSWAATDSASSVARFSNYLDGLRRVPSLRR
ncbi:MAG TPA: EAL domain-containing protein [Gammaproteobacteria bacterium]|jgi:EAL domain-containing protein (putative c-di-GMP-specific phosphodiesterase class I)|nr:EAL domain-containing protein [Gammaproteobacteria bacterium]